MHAFVFVTSIVPDGAWLGLRDRQRGDHRRAAPGRRARNHLGFIWPGRQGVRSPTPSCSVNSTSAPTARVPEDEARLARQGDAAGLTFAAAKLPVLTPGGVARRKAARAVRRLCPQCAQFAGAFEGSSTTGRPSSSPTMSSIGRPRRMPRRPQMPSSGCSSAAKRALLRDWSRGCAPSRVSSSRCRRGSRAARR